MRVSFLRIMVNSQKLKRKKQKKHSSLSINICKYSLTATSNTSKSDSSFSYGRAASFTFENFRASLTLETAIALPIFMFLCISIIFFCQMFSVHSEIQGSLFRAAKDVSGNVLLVQTGLDENLIDSESAMKLVCVEQARRNVLEYSGGYLDECICLEGGADGLSFICSAVTEEYADLIVSYKIHLPYAFGVDATFPVVQRCRIRLWTGISGRSKTEDMEELVYITETGTVYHKSAECTHLKLTIRTINCQELSSARNNNGGKYKQCDKCAKEGAEGSVVYITNEGDCYHNTLSCSGLKRTVQQVSKSEVRGKSACIRCGR